jgi:RNA polymerase-associated protein
MTLRRIQKDWDSLVDTIENGSEAEATKARKELSESLTVVSPIFEQKPFFMNDEFSLMDCAVAPILWRLPKYRVELSPQAKLMLDYSNRIFDLENFKSSLSEQELEMR